jgi:hypothetical protein
MGGAGRLHSVHVFGFEPLRDNRPRYPKTPRGLVVCYIGIHICAEHIRLDLALCSVRPDD